MTTAGVQLNFLMTGALKISPINLILLLVLLQQKADRKSTRLNSSHSSISYAVFCLKKKKKIKSQIVLKNTRTKILKKNTKYTQLTLFIPTEMHCRIQTSQPINDPER